MNTGNDQIRSLVFDLDGTMYSSSLEGPETRIIPAVRRQAAAALGIELRDASTLLQGLRSRHGHYALGLRSEHGLDPVEFINAVYSDVGHDDVVLRPGLAEILANLANNYEISVLTNSPRKFATEILRKGGVSDFVRVRSVEDLSYQIKPHPSVYEGLMGFVATDDPRTICYFDDSVRNVSAAWKHRIESVLVSNDAVDPPWFWEMHLGIKHLPPAYADSTHDLVGYLAERFGHHL